MERMVVIGGDAGGMSAAAQARRMRPLDELEIVAFERGPRTSYAACGLPYLLSGDVATPESLVARSPEKFRMSGIDARVHHEVLAIDSTRRAVLVRELVDGKERWEPFDHLVVGTGSLPVRPPLPGIDAAGVHDLRTIDDALAIEETVGHGRRAVVVGGGYIGIEVAEAMIARGMQVSLVEALPQVMASLSPDMAVPIAEAMEKAGVTLHLGEPVEGFESGADGRVRAVVTAEQTLEADVVVLGLGAKPNIALAREAGLAIGPSGGIAVDDRMETSVESVWAAGDVVQSHHRVSGRPVVIALGTHANKQGRVVGTNIAGGDARFGGVLGTAITKFQDLEIARTGLTEAEAEIAGFDWVELTAEARTRAHYYQGGSPITVRLVGERGTGRLLGGQIVGGPGAGKRIDVVATALWAGMTVGDFAGMDLAYAPPFSPVWDPVLLAAGRLDRLVSAISGYPQG
ncbi:MAG TPA: FAD-dependent oxidoreductase [Acidimicrobiales bacterium]